MPPIPPRNCVRSSAQLYSEMQVLAGLWAQCLGTSSPPSPGLEQQSCVSLRQCLGGRAGQGRAGCVNRGCCRSSRGNRRGGQILPGRSVTHSSAYTFRELVTLGGDWPQISRPRGASLNFLGVARRSCRYSVGDTLDLVFLTWGTRDMQFRKGE